jgi:hypothetical protein
VVSKKNKKEKKAEIKRIYNPTGNYIPTGGYEPTGDYQLYDVYVPTGDYMPTGAYVPTENNELDGYYVPTGDYVYTGGYIPTGDYEYYGIYVPTGDNISRVEDESSEIPRNVSLEDLFEETNIKPAFILKGNPRLSLPKNYVLPQIILVSQ